MISIIDVYCSRLRLKIDRDTVLVRMVLCLRGSSNRNRGFERMAPELKSTELENVHTENDPHGPIACDTRN
jgi:hypothetical protein